MLLIDESLAEKLEQQMFDSKMIRTSMCVSAEACGSRNVSTQICLNTSPDCL